jgi:lipoate-protein ligase A
MFVEPHPDVVAPNPGGPRDPLGESVLDPAQPWLRVFAPADIRLVIGRHQDPARELLLDHARADGVPIHRRVSGGGAVVLAPGMVVVAVRFRPLVGRVMGGLAATVVNAGIARTVERLTGVAPATRGLGDLAVADGGAERKILGSSLRQTATLVAYLGVILVDDATALMERLLAAPSRQPDYRAGRQHDRFCTHLARFGATTPALVAALGTDLERDLQEWALPASAG